MASNSDLLEHLYDGCNAPDIQGGDRALRYRVGKA